MRVNIAARTTVSTYVQGSFAPLWTSVSAFRHAEYEAEFRDALNLQTILEEADSIASRAGARNVSTAAAFDNGPFCGPLVEDEKVTAEKLSSGAVPSKMGAA